MGPGLDCQSPITLWKICLPSRCLQEGTNKSPEKNLNPDPHSGTIWSQDPMDGTLKNSHWRGIHICHSIVVKIERACLSLRGSYVPNINPQILLLKALISKFLEDGPLRKDTCAFKAVTWKRYS